MIALLASVALADPVALRATPEAAPAVTVGQHVVSVGGPVPLGALELGAHLGTDAASLGIAAGRRWTLWRGRTTQVLTSGLSGGLLLPTLEPGLALTGTPWMAGGWSGDRGLLTAGGAVPLALGTGGVRVPLLAELQAGLRLGPVWVVARLGIGPVVVPGVDTSVWMEPGLALSLP